jgi:hypothetical protein
MAAIRGWLDDHQTGWEQSVVTFVPGVMICGRDFTLNFLGDGAILNYEQGQFVRSVDPDIYSILACVGE